MFLHYKIYNNLASIIIKAIFLQQLRKSFIWQQDDNKGQTFFFLLFVSILVCWSTTAQSAQIGELAISIGMGYHILYGNPKSQYGLDPGLKYQAFSYSYLSNLTTHDNKFLIPDQLISEQSTSCSYISNVSQFRGTLSYQQSLKQTVQVNRQLEPQPLIDCMFSKSRSFINIEQKTINQSMSITHATASCQVYKLTINQSRFPQLNQTFANDALNAYKKSTWKQFIQKYGTHYVSQVGMGGRVTRQTTYTSKSISILENLKIDRKIAAEAQMAKYFNDPEYDWSKYLDSVGYLQKMKFQKRQLLVSDEPPETGHVQDWRTGAISNPMPIRYKLLPISNLFERITNSSFNYTNAVINFKIYLEMQLFNLNCKPAIADLPLPLPVTITVQKTPLNGIVNGVYFEQFTTSPTMLLRKMRLQCGGLLDSMKLIFDDQVNEYSTDVYGGTGGALIEWQIPQDQRIRQISFYLTNDYSFVNDFQFVTNKQNIYSGCGLGWYGEQSQYQQYHYNVLIPEEYTIIGLYGQYQNVPNQNFSSICKLGFILGKVQYPQPQLLDKQNLLQSQISLLKSNIYNSLVSKSVTIKNLQVLLQQKQNKIATDNKQLYQKQLQLSESRQKQKQYQDTILNLKKQNEQLAEDNKMMQLKIESQLSQIKSEFDEKLNKSQENIEQKMQSTSKQQTKQISQNISAKINQQAQQTAAKIQSKANQQMQSNTQLSVIAIALILVILIICIIVVKKLYPFFQKTINLNQKSEQIVEMSQSIKQYQQSRSKSGESITEKENSR